MRILEVINRGADTYNPRPKDAYQDATTNTIPKSDCLKFILNQQVESLFPSQVVQV